MKSQITVLSLISAISICSFASASEELPKLSGTYLSDCNLENVIYNDGLAKRSSVTFDGSDLTVTESWYDDSLCSHEVKKDEMKGTFTLQDEATSKDRTDVSFNGWPLHKMSYEIWFQNEGLRDSVCFFLYPLNFSDKKEVLYIAPMTDNGCAFDAWQAYLK